jgi:4-hydroxy-tetrahydrodipicolinate synthase
MTWNRRTVMLGIAGAGLVEPAANSAPASFFRGLYPIAQTPFTPGDRLDHAALARQVDFCQRNGVPGLIWPQLASDWEMLNESERLAGAVSLLKAARGTSVKVVIGIQARDRKLSTALRFANHAMAHGAAAIISLPLEGASEDSMVDYYKAVGAATPLPLVLQTHGAMSIDLVERVYREVPTLACVKDEAGEPLDRIGPIRKMTGGKVAIFAGKGCVAMLNEMMLGFDGYCPSMFCTDLFQRVFELWNSGRRKEATELFGRIMALRSIPGVMPYLMVLRGIFPADVAYRNPPNRKKKPFALSEDEKALVRQTYDAVIRPYTRG